MKIAKKLSKEEWQMYEAIGEISKKRYALGETKEMVHQFLIDKYPSEESNKNPEITKTRVIKKLYPEPLIIKKVNS